MKYELSDLENIAVAIADVFGEKCEVVIHEVNPDDLDHTIVSIVNGHNSGRKVGDGLSISVLKALQEEEGNKDDTILTDTIWTDDGKCIRTSTVFIKEESGVVRYVFAINFDVTTFQMAKSALDLVIGQPKKITRQSHISNSVNDLLETLILESVDYVNKPVAMMDKEDKVKAVNYLNDAGALLIKKSSEKICKFFDISKYTLYSYLEK